MISDNEFYIPFGKHSGESLDDISRSYLEWLLEQEWMYEKDKEFNYAAI